MFTPELIKGGKDKEASQSIEYTKKIIDESEIKEEKVFSKAEILGLIEQISKAEGIKADHLEISNEIYNKEGDLVMFSVSVKKGRSLGKGYRSIEYDYMIKGEHDGSFSSESTISRGYNLGDPEISQCGIVARFKNNKWELSPNKINSKLAENIRPVDDK